MVSAIAIVVRVLSDLIEGIGLAFRQRKSLEAEVLFLRRQLALHMERGVKPRRVDAATRVSLALLSRLFEWRSALVVVRPETLIRWHRTAFRLFSRWKSRSGRSPIPLGLRQLIRRMARENPLWSQERIANELWVKLGLRVSPRTVRKYLPRAPAGCPRGDQRWSTFLKNHAQAIVACDFFVAVTCGLRLLYVFVVMEHRSRRLIHCNVTAHPSALWTRQQLREALGYETRYRYLIHARDTPRSPTANGICERMIGTIRRECLDWLIPLSEAHLRRILKLWIAHYNRGRPHLVLGLGVPDPPVAASKSVPKSRHRLDDFGSVRGEAVLGGLHHEYSLAPA